MAQVISTSYAILQIAPRNTDATRQFTIRSRHCDGQGDAGPRPVTAGFIEGARRVGKAARHQQPPRSNPQAYPGQSPLSGADGPEVAAD
jgi:hypothetical protein